MNLIWERAANFKSEELIVLVPIPPKYSYQREVIHRIIMARVSRVRVRDGTTRWSMQVYRPKASGCTYDTKEEAKAMAVVNVRMP